MSDVGPVPVTLAEAADDLPYISAGQLARIVGQLPNFPQLGTAQSTGGRRAATFDLADVQELHHVLRRWL